MLINRGKIQTYGEVIFQENKVSRGVFHIYQSEGTKIHSKVIIQGNIATWGVFLITQSIVQMNQTILIQGNNVALHTVDFRKSTIGLNGEVYFINNTGCILIEESQVEFNNSIKFSNNERQKKQHMNMEVLLPVSGVQ